MICIPTGRPSAKPTGIEAAAEKAGLERLDMVFFTPEQVATMKNGEITSAQQRHVDIWNKVKAKAAAGG